MLTGGHGRGGNGQEGQENVCELHLRQRPREGPHHQQAPGSHTRMQTTNKANNNVAERPLEPTAHLGCLRVCRGAGRVCQKRIRRSATSILKYVGIWLSCKGYRTTNWVTRRRRVSYAVQNPQCAAGEAAAPAPGSPDISRAPNPGHGSPHPVRPPSNACPATFPSRLRRVLTQDSCFRPYLRTVFQCERCAK